VFSAAAHFIRRIVGGIKQYDRGVYLFIYLPIYLFIHFIIQVVLEVQEGDTTISQKINTNNYKWKNQVPIAKMCTHNE